MTVHTMTTATMPARTLVDYTAQTQHAYHRGGHGFLATLIHGFAWRTGSDAANQIFHLAPRVITALVVIALIGFAIRWLIQRRHVDK